MSCLTENTILQLVQGRLAPPARAEAELHLDGCPDCLRAMAEAAKYMHEPVRGQHVARYVLEEPLGAGGMGVVYRAYDPKLDRKVALKLLRSDEDDASLQARLLREAQAMARLSHPNVVAVHDVGEVDGRVFVAMELVDGCTLGAWLAQKPRPWREVVAVFIAAGRGLAAAHAVGLVHRDFKPANVLIGSDGRARVTDFGLAREDIAASGVTRSLHFTQTGTFAGTPAYMAPEQFARRPTSARTDQFSFAVACYEALYRERPFEGDTLLQIAESVTSGIVRARPRTEIPDWLQAIIVRGLAVDPAARFPTIDAMLHAIERGLYQPRRRSKRLVVIGAATLALTAGGIAALVLVDRDYHTAPKAAAVQHVLPVAVPPPPPAPAPTGAPTPEKPPVKKRSISRKPTKPPTRPRDDSFSADAPISPWAGKH